MRSCLCAAPTTLNDNVCGALLLLRRYKATRIIAEVVIESLPQCFLQSYIYVTVVHHVAAGTASPSEQVRMMTTGC